MRTDSMRFSVPLRCSFITEDRETANNVLQFFRSNRIGLASCDILSELRDKRLLPASSLRSDTVALASKVLSLEKFRPVIEKYFSNWVVVPDRNAAVQALEADNAKGLKPFNVVTLSGELFKKVRHRTISRQEAIDVS